MDYYPWYVTVLPVLPVILVHLAGVVAAIVLLVRRSGTPAILSLVGFGLLFVLDLVSFAKVPLTRFLVRQVGMRQFVFVDTGVNCCCGLFNMIALVCLVVAIWQAVSVAAVERV